MPIDAVFMPIKRVAYNVEPARVGESFDYDKLANMIAEKMMQREQIIPEVDKDDKKETDVVDDSASKNKKKSSKKKNKKSEEE